jgi:glycosyltransferase involved in cell wall biosynthesis
MPDGVNVVGYVHEDTGLGEVARLVVATLRHAGIPHEVIPVGRRSLRERLVRPDSSFPTNIVCINAQMLPGFVEASGASFLRDRRTIGFWWWEVDRFPSVMGWASQLVDEIWVGSEHVRSAVASTVSRPVHVFPMPIVEPPLEPVSRKTLGIPDARFAFLFSFNFRSVFERKNPLGLIDAFARAFAPDEGPVLVLKTINARDFPRESAQLGDAASQRPDIVLVERHVTRRQHAGLVAACDAYASLHRAEGFGLPIAEAMALRKPSVATGYSGNLAFMNDQNSYLVPSHLVPIPHATEPYIAGGSWAEPDLDAAATLLRRVVERRDEANAKVETAVADLQARHGLDAAASFIRTKLAEPAAARRFPDDAVERAAAELMWGPDLETARPWARRIRHLARPILRPYVDHHRRVGALVLEALAERERPSQPEPHTPDE